MTTPVIHAAAPETRNATECPTSSDANQHITDALGIQDAGHNAVIELADAVVAAQA